MKQVVRLLYSLILNPLVFFTANILAPFSGTLRRAIAGRYSTIKQARRWRTNRADRQPVVLVHASSMGEFEHIKPLVDELHKRQIAVVLTFFSPSGYEHVKEYPGIELIIYAPFDFAFLWKGLFKIIQPLFLVISKHDVWPNQVWACQKLNIPSFLVNASLRSNSSRIKIPGRYLLKYVYSSLTLIYTISNEDKNRFMRYFPTVKVQVAGDTKFDQVLLRKRRSAEKEILAKDWMETGICILFGSVWPEDAQVFLPALNQLLSSMPQARVILVPHQPSDDFVGRLKTELSAFDPVLFSQESPAAGARVLIVDVIGILPDLYKYAQIAYVGGSFKQGIHNVMEPAIYGIPVFYGPVHKNSLEAMELLKEGGARLITDSSSLEKEIGTLMNDHSLRRKIGRKALSFAQKNVGAAQRIMDSWMEILKQYE